MIINPRYALEKGWITSPEKEIDVNNQLQQNGIDVRLKTAIRLPVHKPFRLLKNKTLHLDKWKPEGGYVDNDWTIIFERGIPYLVECFEYVKVPENAVALVYGRSTLNRNGIFARSSVYDSGFENYVGFSIYPFVPLEAHIGVRIAQIVFFSAESNSLYRGQYGVI